MCVDLPQPDGPMIGGDPVLLDLERRCRRAPAPCRRRSRGRAPRSCWAAGRTPRAAPRRSSATSRRGGTTASAHGCSCAVVHCRPYHSLPRWKTSRTRMFIPSTATMMTSAPAPGEILPVRVGRAREVVDRLGQVGHGPAEVAVGPEQPGQPVRAAERREQQRRRLAGDADDGERGAGDEAAARRATDDAQRHPPARRAHGQGRLAQLVGHQVEDVLGGARHHRQHDERQRDRAGEAGVVAAAA